MTGTLDRYAPACGRRDRRQIPIGPLDLEREFGLLGGRYFSWARGARLQSIVLGRVDSFGSLRLSAGAFTGLLPCAAAARIPAAASPAFPAATRRAR